VTRGTRSTPAHGGPGLERTITLTDAVVAIAMTLLVLPLVDTARDFDVAHLGTFLHENSDLLLSFVISFLVISAFWSVHGSAYRRATEADVEPRALRQLNVWWLLLVAFLPFPTAVVGRDLDPVSGPFYLGTMTLLSAITSAIVTVVGRVTGDARHVRWAWLTTAVFALGAGVSAVAPTVGTLVLLLIAVVRVLETRVLAAREPRAPTTAAGGTAPEK
jgi:uncharacterized membrane protein